MPKKAGIIFVALGVVLILSALLLFCYNGFENYCAGQQAESLMADIHSVIAEETESPAKPAEIEIEIAETEETLSDETSVVMIDGYEYIGYISIPEWELELPVMGEWDYSRLKIAPCRHFGAAETDDLVIAGHNYKTHFGPLHRLEEGEEIVFTQINGVKNKYTLSRLEILAPDAVEEVLNSGYDLVLYTCTLGGATRVVAFCDRVTENICGEVTE